jgi:hypothetical protein
MVAAPAAADAKPGYVVLAGGYNEELSLRGSNGYDIQVEELNHRSVSLTAYKGSSQVVYLLRRIHGKGDGIEARFPGVGRVSVRFHQQGRTQGEAGFFPPCRGGETATRRGYFSGTIRFRGERGYTVVRARRARGEITTTAKEVCKRSIFDDSDSEPEPTPEEAHLFANASSGGRRVGFSANTTKLPAGTPVVFTNFFGFTWERRGRMYISRLVFVRGAEEDFSLGDAGDFPQSATVTPPGPFRGSAFFQRASEGDNAWTGSLSVVLPGVGHVALAGPSFTSRLCQGAGCRREEQRSRKDGMRSARFLDRASRPLWCRVCEG